MDMARRRVRARTCAKHFTIKIRENPLAKRDSAEYHAYACADTLLHVIARFSTPYLPGLHVLTDSRSPGGTNLRANRES